MTNTTLPPAPTKWVKVMAEYGTCGLWKDKKHEYRVVDVPLSAEILSRLKAWCEWYEKNDWLLLSNFPWVAFGEEGLEIAKLIKAELPDWTVIYFDESAALLSSSQDAPEPFEYEIG